MEHTVEVFYVSAEQGSKAGRHELGKFFSREAADAHAKDLSEARGHTDVSVEMRVESWKDQDISHRPG